MGAPPQTGAETTSEATDEAPAAVALIGPGGTLERATTRFLHRYGAAEECLSAHQRKIDRVVAGEIDHVAVMLDGDVADVSAVIASDTQRYALVSVPLAADEATGDCPNPALEKPIEDSPAVVWLKDLDGRYIRVNSRYAEELQTSGEHVCGKRDAELALSESIEGMRHGPAGGLAHEPLELEYTVGAYEDRPSYSVVRFALRGREGQPIAVCGVAAPLSRAWLARAECDRLVRIERWSRLEEAELREELLDEWGLAPLSETLVASSGKNGHGEEGEGAQFAAIAAELDTALATSARLDRELAEERRQVMALREASILSARRAHELLGTVTAERARAADLEHAVSRAEARAVELEGELTAERSRTERVEARSAEAAEAQGQTIDTLQLELSGLQEELERARTAVSEAPTPELLGLARTEADEARRAAKDAEAVLEAERERVGRAEAALADLREAAERTESETSAALAAEKKRRQALETELAAAREELARTEQAAQQQVERARQSTREEVERAQRALQEELERAHQAAQEEVEQARQAAAQAAAVRVARTEADAQKTLGGVREELGRARTELDLVGAELRRARAEAADSLAALADEQRRAEAVQAELSAVQAELERLRDAMAESVDEHHGRIAEAEAARAQARTDAAELTSALETQRKTVEALSAELEQARAAGTESAAGATHSAAALADEQRRAEALQAELSAVQAELERLRDAMAESVDEQHGRIAEAEAARAQARTQAAELATALESERKTVEALRADLHSAQQASETAVQEDPERDRLAAALAAEQQRVLALQAEVESVRAEAEEALAAARQAAPARAQPDAPQPATAAGPDAPVDGPHWDPAAQRALAHALADVAEWRMALQRSARTLTAEGGWDAAIAFCPDDRRRLLECVAITTSEALAETTFETQGWQHRPDVTRREFGSAWNRPEPSTVTDLGAAEDRLLKAAAAQGMASAALVPVRNGAETIAILGLFSRVNAAPSAEVMISLEGVGLQVGAIGHLMNAAGAPRWRVGRL